MMAYPAKILSEVFRNISGHVESSEIIFTHSTNNEDIREFALKNIDLSETKSVIDLGCGFGFFTQALKNKIPAKAIVNGIDCFSEYSKPFLDLCRDTGFTGRFDDSGLDALNRFNPSSVDLVISSFSLYFFPEVVPKVAELLKPSGMFIVITHFSSHLQELTGLISKILNDMGYPGSSPLPHDRLIMNFPADESVTRLSGYFGQTEERKYFNELVFTNKTIDRLISYLLYKNSFFVPDAWHDNEIEFSRLVFLLRQKLVKLKEFRITKNDGVHICTHPYKNKA